jgi:hypothetical protein
VENSASDSVGSNAILEITARRLMSDGERLDFIFDLLRSLKRSCSDVPLA